MRTTLLAAAASALLVAAAPGLRAQSNTIPGLDVKLGELSSLTDLGREGVFPNGMNGLAMSTTSCNVGSVNVPWLQVMQENHPFIAFLVVRERGGRMVQISDRSYVKHGFFALSNSQCTPCQNPSPGTFLGIGCSDTYNTSNNGNSFWLGPPDEIDPWLGTWSAQCSHFDKGEPPVAPAQQCDGIRSLTQSQVNALGSVAHRIRVPDAELNAPGSFYYQGHYVIRSEAEALRADNIGSRQFTATWSGSSWNFSTVPGAILYGSILERWPGAAVTSSTNGADDGRVYIGVVVTGPTNGVYRYEYAIHNRDNARGVGAFRLPIQDCTTISNVFFRDVDGNAGNDWTMTQTANELVFSTAGNPLRWNSIFNFGFDSNAAPLAGNAVLDQFDPGAGAGAIAIGTTVPSGLPFSSYGVGTAGCDGTHRMCANSAPSIGNANFAMTCDKAPASSLGLLLVTDSQDVAGSDPFGLGATFHVDFALATEVIGLDLVSDPSGDAIAPAPIPNNPVIVGKSYFAQGLWVWPSAICVPSVFGISTTDAIQLDVTN